MNTTHLSAWEQEEYVLNQRTPQMLRHLAECSACQSAVARLEDRVSLFRGAAVQWSSECLAARPQRLHTVATTRRPASALRWAFVALIPLVLLLLALFPFHLSNPRPAPPAAAISDDALLQQVDEQLSVAVPSSMESLTHLVSAESSSSSGGEHVVQTN